MSVEQPIGIDCVLYMHHWEFPANMKKIPMLTYPIDEEIVILIYYTSHFQIVASCGVIRGRMT